MSRHLAPVSYCCKEKQIEILINEYYLRRKSLKSFPFIQTSKRRRGVFCFGRQKFRSGGHMFCALILFCQLCVEIR